MQSIELRRVCVYCGSNPGKDPAYIEAARRLGTLLGERGITLVYGGSNSGTMGVVADAVLAAGGEVYGVITEALVMRKRAHNGLTRLKVVQSMHERKAGMAELGDAFIALPGGLGTLDEFFEAVTWAQLGIHQKPCGLLNVNGYYDGLRAFLQHAVDQGFVHPAHCEMIMIEEDPARLLDRFAAYVPPVVDKLLG